SPYFIVSFVPIAATSHQVCYANSSAAPNLRWSSGSIPCLTACARNPRNFHEQAAISGKRRRHAPLVPADIGGRGILAFHAPSAVLMTRLSRVAGASSDPRKERSLRSDLAPWASLAQEVGHL